MESRMREKLDYYEIVDTGMTAAQNEIELLGTGLAAVEKELGST